MVGGTERHMTAVGVGLRKVSPRTAQFRPPSATAWLGMSSSCIYRSVDVVGVSRVQGGGAELTGQDEMYGFAKPTIELDMFHVKRIR